MASVLDIFPFGTLIVFDILFIAIFVANKISINKSINQRTSIIVKLQQLAAFVPNGRPVGLEDSKHKTSKF